MNTMSSTSQPPQPRFQFTVVQAFAALALCGLFFGLVVWGWTGVFFFTLLCSLLIAGRGAARKNELFLLTGMLLFLLSFSLLVIAPDQAADHLSYHQLDVKVVDEIGEPVNNAKIRMRIVAMKSLPTDIPLESIPRKQAPHPTERGLSDTAGRETMWYYLTSGWRGVWWDEEYYLVIPKNLWIQGEAHGYQRTSFRIAEVTGLYHDYTAPLPTLEIRLVAENPQTSK